MSRRSLTDGVRHIYHISSIAVHQLQWPMNGKAGLQGVGAVAFKTMAALCVEVEPVRWERGRPRLCNAVLMTGIHWQCQVQVEM